MPGSVRLVSDEHPQTRLELRLLSTWGERLRGLLGTEEDAQAVMLARCASVHTFGMAYDLDIALVGELGEVLLVRRAVPARTFVSHPDACCVIERPAQTGAWLEEGEHLWISALSAGTTGL